MCVCSACMRLVKESKIMPFSDGCSELEGDAPAEKNFIPRIFVILDSGLKSSAERSLSPYLAVSLSVCACGFKIG